MAAIIDVAAAGSTFQAQLDTVVINGEGWTKSGLTYTSPNGPGGDITFKAITSNVATLTTRVAHRLVIGSSVTIAGVDATFNGTYTVTAVTATTFSYAKTATDVATTAATGTVNAYGFNLVFSIVTLAASYFQFQNPQGQNFFINTGAASLAGNFKYTFMAGPQHLFICVEGPPETGTGPASATYGSHRGFFFITTIERLYDNDLTASNRICSGGSHTSSTPTAFEHRVFVKTGLDLVNNAPAELLTMRPMVQSIGALGALPPSRAAASNVMYWPIMVCEQVGGYRGRLNNIFFGGEAYTAGDDVAGQRYSGLTPVVDGKPCLSVEPYWMVSTIANTNQYSPFGVPGGPGSSGIAAGNQSSATDGGPTLIVSTY